jgi:hypothetical protein
VLSISLLLEVVEVGMTLVAVVAQEDYLVDLWLLLQILIME